MSALEPILAVSSGGRVLTPLIINCIYPCLDNYDSLRAAQSTGHGLYDEHNYEQDENIYDEPSDMNYHESDFQQTFSHSDDKFNLKFGLFFGQKLRI